RGYIPTSGVTIRSATVWEHARHWSVSVLVEKEHVVPENTGPVVGVDLGVKRLATLSDGDREEHPRHLKRHLKQITRLQQSVSRTQKGGQTRKKAVVRLAKQHRRVANLRAETLHRLPSRLAQTKAVVVIEDLNVSGMLKNHRLAQAI